METETSQMLMLIIVTAASIIDKARGVSLSDSKDDGEQPQTTVVVPIGAGFKFKIGENQGLRLEFKLPTFPTPPPTLPPTTTTPPPTTPPTTTTSTTAPPTSKTAPSTSTPPSTSILTTKPRPPSTTTSSRPTPPIQYAGVLESCANVLIAVDLSCSVSLKSLKRGKQLIILLASVMKIAPRWGIQLGVITFTRKVSTQDIIRFNKTLSQKEVLEMIHKMDFVTTKGNCQTRTWSALMEADDAFFSEKSVADRTFPNVLIIIGDGLDSPKKHRKITLKYANMLKNEKHVEIIWVVTELGRKHRKPKKETELEMINTDKNNLVLKMKEETTESIARRLAEHLTREYPCGSQ